jgi:MFS family permease
MVALSRRSAALICAAASVRAAAVGFVGVLFAISLAGKGLTPTAIGLVIGAGVAGGAIGTAVTAVYADRWGRRRTLVIVSILAGLGYAGVALTGAFALLVPVAAFGMVNAMGRDRGPASALDQAMLPTVASDDRRTWALAWYNAVVDTGHAMGALAAAIPSALVTFLGFAPERSHAVAFLACGVLVAATAIPYGLLDPVVEVAPSPSPHRRLPIEPEARSRIRRIAALFAVDSIGGGFLSAALVAYWFFQQYGVSEVALAALFFAARILNVVSHLGAAWLARRIGLVNTMVFTHLPSSVLLLLAPLAPTGGIAAALFLMREALVEMDVPTRQSYVMAVVPPAARTFASSVTNLTRSVGWAVGPLLGGPVMQHLALAAPLFIGGTLKIGYDLALYRSFRHVRPPEEARLAASAT